MGEVFETEYGLLILEERVGADGVLEAKRWHGPGSLMYRNLHWRHRLELRNEISCVTLVMTFKVSKKWGFFTRFGWLYWKDYNKQEHC